MRLCIYSELALFERSEVGVTQRMILSNLCCVSAAPQWRSCCRAALCCAALQTSDPWGLDVSHWWTDSMSLKCVFTRWGMQCTWGEMRKHHKLTLMGYLVRRSVVFGPFLIFSPGEVLGAAVNLILVLCYSFMLVNIMMIFHWVLQVL